MNPIPFIDLQAQYASRKAAIRDAVERVLESQHFILGPEVASLEKELSAYLEVGGVVGVSSGTDALLVSLMALGVGPGDEVITTPFSFFATAGCIERVGATPVFVDIEEDTYNLNPALVEEAVTSNTKAIIAVHLFGQCADMASLGEIGRKHQLHVIEDAAQAIGAFTPEGRAGSLGTIACFSFHPTKNLGAAGDAGLVTTTDAELCERVRLFAKHGAKPKYHHHVVGGNFRLDALQAAILRAKLPAIDEWNEARRTHARLYDELLESLPLRRPQVRPGNHMVYQQYTVAIESDDGGSSKRDALRRALADRGVATNVYYPMPLHVQPCFSHLGYRAGSCPVAERASNSVLSLPVYPELGTDRVQEVAVRVREAWASVA